MADPVARLSCGDEHFDLSGLMSDEMAQVKSWTGLNNRHEFYDALRKEDPDAVTAAFTLFRRRNGQPDLKWRDVRVNLDDLQWSRHIGGRDVEMLMECDADGAPLIVVLDGRGIPLRDGDGKYLEPTGAKDEKVGVVPLKTADGGLRWRYVDTGEDVDPTTPETSGPTDSSSTAKKPRRSVSGSGTQTTDST